MHRLRMDRKCQWQVSWQRNLALCSRNSINTVAWNLLEEMTPVTGISYLKEMNFAKLSPEDERPAASLGGFTNGVSPVEMAAAYATIEMMENTGSLPAL